MENQKKKIWGKRLLTAVALVVLCVNLITLFLDATGLRSMLGWLPYGFHAVESGSMEPDICRGDLILIKQVPYEELTIGDDVTYITTEGFVTHRLVGYQGQRFITQGLANAMADPLPMSPESYCGKVIAVIPGLGGPAKALTGAPMAVMVICLIILMLTLGQPLLKRYMEQGEEEQQVVMDLRYRGLICAAAISLLLTMPSLTDAKYLTQLDRYELAVGEPMYFSSNYLSSYRKDDAGQTGNVYSIQGWNGQRYTLNLSIRNYDNSLLFNESDMPLTYAIAVEKLPGKNDENYTVTLSASAGTETAAPFTIPDSWTEYTTTFYKIAGGEPLAQNFNISIAPDADYTPQPDDTVKFAIYACTASNQNYFKELKGSFQLQVAKSNDFLGEIKVEDKGNMVRLSIATNLIMDGSSDSDKLVAIHWENAKLYLNEFERTAFNAKTDPKGRFDKENGLLYMPLQAYSKVELEYFKRSTFTANREDFTIMVVKDVNQEPWNGTPEQTPPATTEATGGGTE